MTRITWTLASPRPKLALLFSHHVLDLRITLTSSVGLRLSRIVIFNLIKKSRLKDFICVQVTKRRRSPKQSRKLKIKCQVALCLEIIYSPGVWSQCHTARPPGITSLVSGQFTLFHFTQCHYTQCHFTQPAILPNAILPNANLPNLPHC